MGSASHWQSILNFLAVHICGRKIYELPPNGVVITVRSIQVKLANGGELGSAVFVEAERPSGKDPGYYKEVTQSMKMIPKNDSVADETRSF